MSEILIVALIGSATTVFGSFISLLIGLRSSSLERERLKIDNKRLQSEIQDRIEQAKVREAESERLKAEKEKIKAEIDKLRRETERITYQPYELECA